MICRVACPFVQISDQWLPQTLSLLDFSVKIYIQTQPHITQQFVGSQLMSYLDIFNGNSNLLFSLSN